MNRIRAWLQNYRRYQSTKRDLNNQARELLTSIAPSELKSDDLEAKAKHLGNLRELIAELNNHSPAKLIERILISALLLSVVVGVTVLIFKRVGSTSIEAEVVATEVRFTLAQKSPVLQPFNVDDLEIYEVSKVELAVSGQSLNSEDGGVVHFGMLRDTTKAQSRNELTVPGLTLPATTSVSVKKNPGNDKFTIAMTAPQNENFVPLVLTAVGPLKIFLGPETLDTSKFAAKDMPYPITLTPLNHEMTLDFSIAKDSTIELLPQIPINAPSFDKEESEAKERQVSAVTSGSITLTELAGEKSDLRAFEPVSIKGCNWNASQECLRLRRLTLSSEGIKAQLYGNVTSLENGPVTAQRNLMPSLLEWINSNHHVKLLWTSIIFAIGLVLGSVRWLKLWT